MTRIRTIALCAALLIIVQSATAQAPGNMPKTTPEHKKLELFVGNWVGEGQAYESPFGPAGKFTLRERTEWFPGDFFAVSHTEMKGPMGECKGLAVLGYDPEKKVYTYHAISSMGMVESATGTIEGDTWMWTNESMVEGKPVKGRYTIKKLSPTSLKFKFEMSTADGPWKTVMEGSSMKSGPTTTSW